MSIEIPEEQTTAVNAQAILHHLHNEAGTLVRVGKEEFAFTRFASRTFDAELVQSLIDQGLLLKIDPTYRTPGRSEFYSISNEGIRAMGGIEMFGTPELAKELGMNCWEIDELTTLHKKLAPIGRIAGLDWRVYGRYSINQLQGELQPGEEKPELKLYKTTAVAKAVGMSLGMVQKHILQRLLYGTLISGRVMVFTQEQVISYLVWLKTRSNHKERVQL